MAAKFHIGVEIIVECRKLHSNSIILSATIHITNSLLKSVDKPILPTTLF